MHSMFPIVISPDKIKKTLKGYKPQRAERFHVESARLADKEFEKALREVSARKVILMSGGSASGKTEFLPDDLKRAFLAFLNRDRKFREMHFYRTHSCSRRTLLWIAENYPEIEIKIFKSSYLKQKDIYFYEYKCINHRTLVEFLKKSQYTEDEIIKITQKRQ